MSDNTESREKKPFLSEEDADQATNEMIWEYFGQKRAFKQGFNAAAEKANARIAELKKRYDDLSGALRFKYEEWEKEKVKVEQLEKERDEFAIQFGDFVEWSLTIACHEMTTTTMPQLLEQFKAARK